MSGAGRPKSRLGKIALQQRFVSADASRAAEPDGGAVRSDEVPAPLVDQLQAMRVPPGLAQRADAHGVAAIDLAQVVMPLEAVRLVPLDLARDYGMLALDHSGAEALVAFAGVPDASHVEEFEFLLGKKVTPYLAGETDLQAAISGAYGASLRGDRCYRPGPSAAVVEEPATGQVAVPADISQLVESALPELPAAPPAVPAATPEPVAVPEASEVEAAPERAAESVIPAVAAAPVVRLDPAFSEPPRAAESHRPLAREGTRILAGGLAADVLEAFRGMVGPGASVDCERNGEVLLQSLAGNLPDLLLLDTSLGGPTTLEVCARVRDLEAAANLPIVVLSQARRGWRFAADLKVVFGVAYVFEQPLDLHLVHDAVRCALQGELLCEDPGPVPVAAESHLRAGMRSFEQGDLDGAIAELRQAAAIAPRSFQLQYHLGLLHGRRGDLFPALSALEVAVELQPHHFSALKNLAVVYQRAGFRHQATGIWERAMWNAPDDETRATIKEHMVRLLH